jgi:GST-like protein
MIELHGAQTGNTLRAVIALEETRLPYEVHKVDLAGGKHREKPYLDLNATARVPTLIDRDGPGGKPLVLTQSNAIMLYVAEKSGMLLPPEGVERVRALEWLFFFVTDVIAPSHQAFFLGRDPAFEGVEESKRRLEERALGMYEHVDKQLDGKRFLAGDSFTLADVAGYTITSSFAKQVPPSLLHVARWMTEVSARPAVKRGLTAFR